MRKIENSELHRLSVEEFKEHEKIPVVLVADNIRSLNNVGSLFRTADAFLIEAFYLCGISATPPNKEIHKTALGAELSVAWRYVPSALEAITELKKAGYKVICIEQVENAVMLDEFCPEKGVKYALVVGNEVKGVGQEVVDCCDGAIEIPQCGTKHSLNVSVAGGVVLWHFFKALRC